MGQTARSKFLVDFFQKIGSGVKVGIHIPSFSGPDRWKTFLYEQIGLEIVKKLDFDCQNDVFLISTKILR